MAGKWRARADAAAAHIQRHVRGWAARELFHGRILPRAADGPGADGGGGGDAAARLAGLRRARSGGGGGGAHAGGA
eukprot:1663309-Prymnesium_polylepis.1